jgi:hypothetical protein
VGGICGINKWWENETGWSNKEGCIEDREGRSIRKIIWISELAFRMYNSISGIYKLEWVYSYYWWESFFLGRSIILFRKIDNYWWGRRRNFLIHDWRSFIRNPIKFHSDSGIGLRSLSCACSWYLGRSLVLGQKRLRSTRTRRIWRKKDTNEDKWKYIIKWIDCKDLC